MQEAHCIEPIGALELYRAGAGLLCAGVEAAFVGLEMLLEVYFKVIFIARGEHAVLFLLGGNGGGHGFADAADGYVRMQRKRTRAGAFVYGRRTQTAPRIGAGHAGQSSESFVNDRFFQPYPPAIGLRGYRQIAAADVV